MKTGNKISLYLLILVPNLFWSQNGIINLNSVVTEVNLNNEMRDSVASTFNFENLSLTQLTKLQELIYPNFVKFPAYDTYDDKTTLPYDIIRKKMVVCDSITETDCWGGGYEGTFWACDSTSRISAVNRIKFQENWSYDEKTNLFIKESTGYTPYYYNEDKEASIPLFNLRGTSGLNPKNLYLITDFFITDCFISQDFYTNYYFNLKENTTLEKYTLIVLLNKIIEKAHHGKLSAFEPEIPFTKKIPVKEFRRRIEQETKKENKVGVANKRLMYRFKFVESWKFDVENNTFIKQVKGIILMERTGNDIKWDGDTENYNTLFKTIAYIKLTDQ